MATAGPSRPSPYRRLSTEIGYRVPQHPGRAAAISALAAQHTALRKGRSHGPGPLVSGLVPPGGTRVRDSERTLTDRHLFRSRRAGLAVTGVVGAMCLLATACSGSSSSGTATSQHGSNGGTSTVTHEGAVVAITPANGSA